MNEKYGITFKEDVIFYMSWFIYLLSGFSYELYFKTVYNLEHFGIIIMLGIILMYTMRVCGRLYK
jgi:hypothetical protein